MGFYGNITNTARTQFQFDLIYPNKTEMIKNQTTDGVYIGRYVLVEYDTETNVHNFDRVYIYNNKLYTSANHESSTLVTKGTYNKGDIVYTAEDTDMSSGYPLSKCAFYVITSDKVTSANPATYEEIASAGTKSNYTYNYNIDMAKGEEGRGYDSTVWQKTYINGVEKYVMIAELNSVVPTFNIVADPPMMTPITPHFDIESTDIYYKLHWQTPWGFRVAEANGTDVTSTTNNKAQLPSDTTATYTINKYNEDTGINTSETSKEYNAAIYYNAAGFKPEKRTRSTYRDNISISPTGQSGNKYNLHTGGASNMGIQPDIMEFSFILPSLGNAISDIWDVVYSTSRNRDIEWKDVLDSEANKDLGGMTRSLSTLAGCINSVHDLMGMIITDRDNATLNEEWYNKHYLYQSGNTYYRIAAEQLYMYPNDATVGTANGIEYKFVEVPDVAGKLSTIYGCILQMRELMGTELDAGTKDRTTVQGSINVLNDLIDLFESKINPSCSVITNSQGQLATSTITTTQMYSAENWAKPEAVVGEEPKDKAWISYNVDGSKKEIEVIHTFHGVENTTTTKNVNDNGDAIITYAPIVDSMGHVVGKNVETTTLPYGYKNVKVGESSAVVNDVAHSGNMLTATNTQDTITFEPSNKWIKMQGNGKVVNISHEVHKFSDGKANTEYGLIANKSVNELDKNNTFEVPVFKFDEAGHVTGARTHTIAIPENFSKVSTKTSTDTGNSIEGTKGTVEADTLTDELSLVEGNQWINLTPNANDDSITINHYVKKFDETANTIDFNNGDKTFDIQNIGWDNAGHLIKSEKTTYTLPNNVKQITIQNSGSSTDNKSTTASNGNLIAETPIDTMTIDTGNRWIQLAADTDNKKVSIYHNIAGTQAGTSQTGSETPKFGKTFLIPEIRYDNLGHITDTTTHTVTIPEPSLNNLTATTSSVITGLSLDATEGKLTQTNTNVGSLALTGYGNENAATAIVATDTINGAIRKLENQISNEVQNRTDSVSNLTDTVKDNYDNLNNAITTEVKDRKEAITTEAANRNTAITGAINALDVDEISADNSYISSIKQIDGKISANTTALPDYSSYWDRISDLEDTVKQLIADLQNANETITDLQNSLNDLSTTVGQLSAKVDEYHPIEEDNTIEE